VVRLVAILIWLAAFAASGAISPVTNAVLITRPSSFAGFTNAFLFKPAESTNLSLVQKFAPLILQEVLATNRVADREQDFFQEKGSLAMYAGACQLLIGRLKHDQVTYWWKYPCPQNRAGELPDALPCQGLRITLNQAGNPVIWEALADAAPLHALYVAGSLEHAALQRHRTRFAGRQFVIEPDPALHPEIWVPITLEDSAVAFGPFVYLRAGTRATATIICRCMPAQVNQVLDTRPYRLLPLPANPAALATDPAEANQLRLHLNHWDATDLEQSLRLPAEF
jgi:hypothetical protein